MNPDLSGQRGFLEAVLAACAPACFRSDRFRSDRFRSDRSNRLAVLTPPQPSHPRAGGDPYGLPDRVPRPGFVYILASRLNGTLYIGVTSDLARRIHEHRTGAVAGFTTHYGVAQLVLVEPFATMREAIAREKALKGWNRAWKLRLIREGNPTWRDLWDDVAAVPNEAASGQWRMDPRLRGDDSVGEGGARYEAVAGPPLSARCSPLPARRSLLPALCALLLAATLTACRGDTPELRLVGDGPEALAALAVEAEAPADSTAETRTAFQTDGAGSVWFDAVAGPATQEASGLTVGGARVLDGWRWWLDRDSLALGPAERPRGVARPDATIRAYAEPDTSGFFVGLFNKLRGETPASLAERVTLLDGRPGVPGALLVEIADSVGTVGFRPVAGDRALSGFRVQRAGDVLLFARADQIPADSSVAAAGAIWTAVAAEGGAVRSVTPTETTPDGGRGLAVALGEVAVPTPGRVVVATGATAALAAQAATSALAQADARRAARGERLAGIVERLGFQTDDATTTNAVRWAALTLDALAVRDSSKLYLQPGVPGMEPPTFPSAMTTMPAWLATGQWEAARGLLLAAGTAQRFDRRIDLLGRAPDLVPYGADPVFATADGTALFLAAAGDYVRTTGDRRIVSSGPNFWFKTVFALRGVFEADRRNGNATDTLGFLATNDRRGTWLDAPTEGGFRRLGAPAEAQGALWQALQTAYDFSKIMGVSGRSTSLVYRDTARVLVGLVDQRYGRGPLLTDRVQGVGQPTADVRPGGLLSLARLPTIPRRAARARALAERLVFPYGVASLDQADSLFHPYLTAPGLYSPEAARSNGAVWTWLAGPVATLMAQTGGAAPAGELLDAQARLMLDRGTVGALPELVAGHARDADAAPEVGGAPVQPWSVATYLAGVYEGMLGVQYVSPETLAVAPRVPEAWGETRVRLRLGDGWVRVAMSGTADDARVEVTPEGALPAGAALRITAGGAVASVALGEMQGDTLTVPREPFTVTLSGGTVEVDGEDAAATAAPAVGDAWEGFAFATPDLRDEYPVMRAKASQRALTDRQILRDDLTASVALTQTDPDGDDWGSTSTFTYPEGTPPGVLDATYMEVARDDSATYVRAEFTALDAASPPPTFVAFIFDTEPGGQRTVGRNARYALAPDEGYEFVVYVGDGLVVEDARGREIGRLPSGRGSVFDPATGSMAFSLPTFILPPLPRGTRVTMLVGARDDDGVGAFLGVEREASDRAGGGRVSTDAPNVYDVITGQTR